MFQRIHVLHVLFILSSNDVHNANNLRSKATMISNLRHGDFETKSAGEQRSSQQRNICDMLERSIREFSRNVCNSTQGISDNRPEHRDDHLRLTFSCLKRLRIFISRRVLWQYVWCSKGLIFLMATLAPVMLSKAELRRQKNDAHERPKKQKSKDWSRQSQPAPHQTMP